MRSKLNPADRSWFIHGGLVLDPADGCARRRELLVRDGVIVATFEPGAPAAAAGAGMPRYDAADKLVLPGLINAHTHGHVNVMKGVADRWPLEVSLTHGPGLAGARDIELRLLTAPARELAVECEPFVARYVADRANDPSPIERQVRSPQRCLESLLR